MALDPIVLLTARYVVAGIFTISAFAKLMRFHDFVAVVAGYRLLPSWAVPPAAVAIPLLEALVSLGLWTQALPAVSSGAAGALLAIFTVAIVVNLVRGRTEIDCGCLGPLLRQRIGWWMVIRNGVLMGLVGLTYPGWTSMNRVYGPADVVFGGLAAAILVILYVAFQLLWTQGPGEVRTR
jgi:hypothetical protein